MMRLGIAVGTVILVVAVSCAKPRPEPAGVQPIVEAGVPDALRAAWWLPSTCHTKAVVTIRSVHRKRRQSIGSIAHPVASKSALRTLPLAPKDVDMVDSIPPIRI